MSAADDTHPDGRGKPEIVVCEDAAALADSCARRVRQVAAAAVRDRGRWRVALAGGSTPRLLYRLLAQPAEPAAADAIDWQAAEIFGDERGVPPDHPDSNYGMVAATLLSSADGAAARVLRMKGEAPDLDAAAREYEADMISASGPRRFVLDLALLGMGADGHTASLFPFGPALSERTRLCVAVDAPKLPARRLTLTYPVFEQARQVFFLVAGRDKAATLRAVLEGPALYRDFPAQPIMRRLAPATIFCDREAASELSSEGS